MTTVHRPRDERQWTSGNHSLTHLQSSPHSLMQIALMSVDSHLNHQASSPLLQRLVCASSVIRKIQYYTHRYKHIDLATIKQPLDGFKRVQVFHSSEFVLSDSTPF